MNMPASYHFWPKATAPMLINHCLPAAANSRPTIKAGGFIYAIFACQFMVIAPKAETSSDSEDAILSKSF
jgi:hypothetical protein